MKHKQIAALLCSSMILCGAACDKPQQVSNNSVETQENIVETTETAESTETVAATESTETAETKASEETKESVAESSATTETKESSAESSSTAETQESLAESTETVESSTQVETAESETKTEEQKVAEEKKQEEQQQQPTQSQLGEGWGPDGIAIDPNCPPLPGENYWDYVDRLNQYYIDQGQIIVVDPAVPDGMPEDWFNF